MLIKNLENIESFIEKLLNSNSLDSVKGSLISFIYPIKNYNPISITNYLNQQNKDYFYWNKPSQKFCIISYEKLISIETFGQNRVKKANVKIERLHKTFINNWDKYKITNVPLFVGAMKFSPDDNSTLWNDFADSQWYIHKFSLFSDKDKNFLVYNFVFDKNKVAKNIKEFTKELNSIDSISKRKIIFQKIKIKKNNRDDIKERERWVSIVQEALKKIASNKFRKIVLSRKVKLELNSKPMISNLILKLNDRYPDCYIFAFHKKNSIFFGASPEKLARFSDGWIEADALAGSISRGKTEKEDLLKANELLSSKKNLTEQKAVVDFIADSFSEFSDKIIFNDKPIIRKLPNIQHLWTPIKAKLNTDKIIFSILKEIHPTPAICGVPWSVAMTSILDMEKQSRGLYAGVIGWFNFHQEGEFAVSIRSALLCKSTVYAFAGCGIVEGSDPQIEYEETKLKLKPILSLFEDEKTD